MAWIRSRSRAELSALIVALEEVLGLLPAPASPGWQGTSNPPWLWDEPWESNPPTSLWLLEVGAQRAQVILALRGLDRRRSLAELRALVDQAPVQLHDDLAREAGQAWVERLRALGASAALRG